MILQIKDVTKFFDGFCALNGVGITVEEKRIHAVIGPNGAGKTTLFNLISGMYEVTQGEILYKGGSITDMKPHLRAKHGIGRTFQIVHLFDVMTALENVMLGRHCKTKAGLLKTFFRFSTKELPEEKETRENAMHWLEFVGLADKAAQVASSLPIGEQRCVEIARALALEPEILLLDEPAAGMNPKETMDLTSLICKVNEMGITVLLIEHNMELAMGISHVISVLNFGEKIAEGVPAEIQANHDVIEAYLGRKK